MLYTFQIYIKINWREEIDFSELREHIKYIPFQNDYCLLVLVFLYLSFWRFKLFKLTA